MHVRYHKSFQKQVLKLPQAQEKRLEVVLKTFAKNPYQPDLYNHPLSGKWRGYRSISFGGDWRAHYRLVGEKTAIFVAAGTHNQLYKS